MSFRARFFLVLLSSVASLDAAEPAVEPSGPPIVNFRLPTFNADGYRTWLARGSQAWRLNEDLFDVNELTLTIFTGLADGRIETMILSPSARVQPAESLVTGKSTIRVINDQFEAFGTDWSYAQKEKKVSIAKNVRVTFRAEFKDLLK